MLIAVAPTSHASAMLARCRTDPIFTLSNGDKITIVLDINTDEANVTYANYVLHVPAGVTVKNVVFTAGGIGKLETYWVKQDSPANTYTTESLVLTRQPGVAMTATTSLQKIVKSIAGYSGQNLIATIKR
jgi:hypothetical protein